MKSFLNNGCKIVLLGLLLTSSSALPISNKVPPILSPIVGAAAGGALYWWDYMTKQKMSERIRPPVVLSVCAAVSAAYVAGLLTYFITWNFTPSGRYHIALETCKKLDKDDFLKKSFGSTEELEEHIKKENAAVAWPIITTFKRLQGQYDDVVKQMESLSDVYNEMQHDKVFIKKCLDLSERFKKHETVLTDFLLRLKTVPYFYKHLTQYQIIEVKKEQARIERVKAASARMNAMR